MRDLVVQLDFGLSFRFVQSIGQTEHLGERIRSLKFLQWCGVACSPKNTKLLKKLKKSLHVGPSRTIRFLPQLSFRAVDRSNGAFGRENSSF